MEIYFFVKEFLGKYNNQLFGHYRYPNAIDNPPMKVECRTSELLIDSAGNIYKCHRDLYYNEHSVGNIAIEDPIEFKFRECNACGQCNVCDIKNKIDRTLNSSRCNVTIKEINGGDSK